MESTINYDNKISPSTYWLFYLILCLCDSRRKGAMKCKSNKLMSLQMFEVKILKVFVELIIIM